MFDSLTLFDTADGPSLLETVSDGCQTVWDCRTVGLSDNVGLSDLLSDLCRKIMSDCRTRAQAAAREAAEVAVCEAVGG